MTAEFPPRPLLALAVRMMPRAEVPAIRHAATRVALSLGVDEDEAAGRADAGEPLVDDLELALAEVWFHEVVADGITPRGTLDALVAELVGCQLSLVSPESVTRFDFPSSVSA